MKESKAKQDERLNWTARTAQIRAYRLARCCYSAAATGAAALSVAGLLACLTLACLAFLCGCVALGCWYTAIDSASPQLAFGALIPIGLMGLFGWGAGAGKRASDEMLTRMETLHASCPVPPPPVSETPEMFLVRATLSPSSPASQHLLRAAGTAASSPDSLLRACNAHESEAA